MDNTVNNNTIESESRLTFFEATSIIVGHGVGSGILAVPYIASRTSWASIILIIAVAYAINLLMHLMIAELSLNNGGKPHRYEDLIAKYGQSGSFSSERCE